MKAYVEAIALTICRRFMPSRFSIGASYRSSRPLHVPQRNMILLVQKAPSTVTPAVE